MNTSHDPLRASAADLRRITADARLLLLDRPAPADIDALRSLRVELVACLARFQQIVHLVLDEAAESGLEHLRDAISLKIGAIGLSRAYDEFRSRWMERHFLSNWAEYRLSALRMINIIHVAIAPVDQLDLAHADEATWRTIDATTFRLSTVGNIPCSGFGAHAGSQIENPSHRKDEETLL